LAILEGVWGSFGDSEVRFRSNAIRRSVAVLEQTYVGFVKQHRRYPWRAKILWGDVHQRGHPDERFNKSVPWIPSPLQHTAVLVLCATLSTADLIDLWSYWVPSKSWVEHLFTDTHARSELHRHARLALCKQSEGTHMTFSHASAGSCFFSWKRLWLCGSALRLGGTAKKKQAEKTWYPQKQKRRTTKHPINGGNFLPDPS